MFEVPEAKRVRREDLRDSSPDTDSNDDDAQNRAELEAKLRESLAGSFSFDVFDRQTASSTAPPTIKQATSTEVAEKKTDRARPETVENNDARKEGSGDEEGAETEEREEFEFRLFKSAPATKVVLPDADEDEVQGDGAMARRRPMSYYIPPPLSTEQREAIAFAALSGEQVMERAKQRSWGMEMPWRVTHVGVAPKSLRTGTSAETLSVSVKKLGDGDGDEEKAKRKRPGKKRRIAARTREREAKKKAEAADKSKMTKEEHLREKKKRLNRQRKLKRRAKAKDGKGGDAADAVDDADSSDGSGN